MNQRQTEKQGHHVWGPGELSKQDGLRCLQGSTFFLTGKGQGTGKASYATNAGKSLSGVRGLP